MDDILRRLGNVEKSVGDLRSQVDIIAGKMPHLATAESVAEIKAIIPHLATAESVAEIKAALPYLATKASLSDLKSELIKWMIATVLAATGTAFSIAKFVH